jgi:hypothetical protein
MREIIEFYFFDAMCAVAAVLIASATTSAIRLIFG